MMCSFLSYTACFFQLSVYHIWSHLSCFFFVNFGTCPIYRDRLRNQYPVRGSFTGFLYTVVTQRDTPCTHCPLYTPPTSASFTKE